MDIRAKSLIGNNELTDPFGKSQMQVCIQQGM